ncbi:DUF4974 domain-containing protein [Chitinophaga sp. SYP-B3965]|uniref:FecR family protein n=1 Tax=Chitinophaga sp. SYP-B3965 TaxID=2663120 RepID=UPI001299B5E6|nr:FecR family protein [Chitinophaga sp. SYP-B3965]MRG45161.1 DUF4974 domain-containing protein [Chitinophaga sp. SYP-B3965]
MEQHYSNLVQKYLAKSLTASEQEELAAMSRLPKHRAELEEMIIAEPAGQQGDSALKQLREEEQDLVLERQLEDPLLNGQTAHQEVPARNGYIAYEEDVPARNGHTTHEDVALNGHTAYEDTALNGHTAYEDAALNGHTAHEDAALNGYTAHEDAALNGHTAHEDVAFNVPTAHEDAALNGHTTHEDAALNARATSEGEVPSRNWYTTYEEEFPARNGRIPYEEAPSETPPEATPPRRKSIPPPPQRQRLDLESRIAVWKEKPSPETAARQKLILRIATAILFIGTLSVGYYILLQRKVQQQKIEKENRRHITAGSSKATLILSDGSAITLDNTKDGPLTVQGGVEVLQSDNGLLAYNVPASGAKAVFNTIATPRGGEYQLTLPDGSHITLNSASSITFPTVFNGATREVTLSGEAFFEVAEDSARPFRVKAGETIVEVIGTSFNIMSYAGEPIQNTTMVSGTVKLNALGVANILRPGEQAILNYHPGRIQVKGADVEEAVAWKNGKFQFVKRDISTIMRQVERWYDVDVELKGDFSDVVFSAVVPRKEPLSQLLEALEATGDVHFETEGKKITVFPGD